MPKQECLATCGPLHLDSSEQESYQLEWAGPIEAGMEDEDNVRGAIEICTQFRTVLLDVLTQKYHTTRRFNPGDTIEGVLALLLSFVGNLEDHMTASPVAFVLSDPNEADNPIVYCSDTFIEQTGYSREQVVGRNCRFLQGPLTDPSTIQELSAVINSNRGGVFRLANYESSGQLFENILFITPICFGGTLVAFLGTQLRVIDVHESFCPFLNI